MRKLGYGLLEAMVAPDVGQVRFDYLNAGLPVDDHGSPYSASSWQHLCYAWQQDGTIDSAEFYVNARKSCLVTGTESITATSWEDLGTSIELGPLVLSWQSPRFYTGVKLTASEILDLYTYDWLPCREHGHVFDAPCLPRLTNLNHDTVSVTDPFLRYTGGLLPPFPGSILQCTSGRGLFSHTLSSTSGRGAHHDSLTCDLETKSWVGTKTTTTTEWVANCAVGASRRQLSTSRRPSTIERGPQDELQRDRRKLSPLAPPVVDKAYEGTDRIFNCRCDASGVDVSQLPRNGSYTISATVKPTRDGRFGIVGWGQWNLKNGVLALRLKGSRAILHYWWGDDLEGTYGGCWAWQISEPTVVLGGITHFWTPWTPDDNIWTCVDPVMVGPGGTVSSTRGAGGLLSRGIHNHQLTHIHCSHATSPA